MFRYCLQRLLFLYLTRDITQNQCSKLCTKKSKHHETLKKIQDITTPNFNGCYFHGYFTYYPQHHSKL